METLVERLNKLKELGYTENFTVRDGQLLNGNSQPAEPNALKIDDTYRIEDDSDPTHQTIIYALSSKDQAVKGVLVDSYGPDSSSEKTEVIETISKS